MAFDDALGAAKRTALDVVALDDALRSCAAVDARWSRVVGLRFFGGLSLEDISAVLKIVPATAQRAWTAARAWLHREMSRKENS